MKLNELKTIMFRSASETMRKEGKDSYDRGLVTNFEGKNINNIYHIYCSVKDRGGIKEERVHIQIDFQKKKLKSVECSCKDFEAAASNGYTVMCSHITAASYKLLNLLSKGRQEASREDKPKTLEDYKKDVGKSTGRLIRKIQNASVYYEGQFTLGSEKCILKPNEIRLFLEKIKSKKIKFKFDFIEFIVPILIKDLPLTFNLKEDGEHMLLTTHKQLPIPLNSNNDVYFFKNELYLPSKSQIQYYAPLYEKLKAHNEIIYRKSIDNYNKLIPILSVISQNINISEGVKDFVANALTPEFYVFEENGKVYCDVTLNYGSRKVNILQEEEQKDALVRALKKEEKLLMKIERNSFIRLKKRFLFIGSDEELFKILTGRGDSIHSLGKVILGKGLEDRRIYNSADIKAEFEQLDGYYDFSYDIGDLEREELADAFEAYKANNKFYKTRENDFLDFEDESVRNLFQFIELLQTNENTDYRKIELEENRALYLYENIKNTGLGYIKNAEQLKEIEYKLTGINNSFIGLPEAFNGTLREYQIKGYKWLKVLSEIKFGGILADEMGLGKTIQTIAFLLSEPNKRSIIVCPTSLIYNWKEEFQKFAPSLKVLIVHGANRPQTEEDMDGYDVILTTYGTLRNDISCYSNMVFDCCILDEAQNIKNPSSQNAKTIKEIRSKVKFALTGTPIENNLMELWSIFDFVMPGYLYTKEEFEQKFILRGEENLENLKTLIKPFILRRTKKEVIKELPDKIESKFLVQMTEAQKAVYSSYIKRVRATLKNGVSGRIEIFSYLTKLRQICLDPSLILDEYEGGNGKLEVAMELIKDHIASGGKVLLFSQFTSVLDKIGLRLNDEKINFLHLDGKTKPKDRIDRVKEFNSSQSIKVFLISLKAGGTGLNLTSANLVIHFDPWWNPAVENQATDRAHRIGQNDIVKVIKLVAKGTIEEKIIMLQEDKKELIASILTGELKNSGLLSNLSQEDMLQLFGRE